VKFDVTYIPREDSRSTSCCDFGKSSSILCLLSGYEKRSSREAQVSDKLLKTLYTQTHCGTSTMKTQNWIPWWAPDKWYCWDTKCWSHSCIEQTGKATVTHHTAVQS